MTKKDYVKLAAALNRAAPRLDWYAHPKGPPRTHGAEMRVWNACMLSIADVLAADNPRFNRARFIKACSENG